MDSYRETAFYLTLWYAVLTALGAVLLIALNDVALATAFLDRRQRRAAVRPRPDGRVGRLTDRHITRGQFWRTLPPQSAPPGEPACAWRAARCEETWLRFAKGAAAVAIVLSGLAYASNGVSAAAWAKAVAQADRSRRTSRARRPGRSYRSARLLPTN